MRAVTLIAAIIGSADSAAWLRDALTRGGATVRTAGPGVDRAAVRAAVRGARLVIGATDACDAASTADQVVEEIDDGAIYVDSSSAAPSAMAAVSVRFARRGVLMADTAVMGRAEYRVMIASGPGARVVQELIETCGIEVAVVGPDIGDATMLGRQQASFLRELAVLTEEALGAARSRGAETWMRSVLAADLAQHRGSIIEGARVDDEIPTAQRRTSAERAPRSRTRRKTTTLTATGQRVA